MVQAEAQMRVADANLEKSLIRATRTGTITQKACEVGEFVMPGTPIYELVDYAKVEVQAQLPERLATRVKTGDPAVVRIDALNREVLGRVSVIVPAAARTAKTFELRIEVGNPELKILVGMAATVRIEIDKHDKAVVAPQDVVIEEPQGRSVFVEADGVAHKRPVVLGPAVDGRVILEDGVKEGDRLVVVGQRTLVDGQPVRVLQ
jgi:RND family efflux transporter MFP subunit